MTTILLLLVGIVIGLVLGVVFYAQIHARMVADLQVAKTKAEADLVTATQALNAIKAKV